MLDTDKLDSEVAMLRADEDRPGCALSGKEGVGSVQLEPVINGIGSGQPWLRSGIVNPVCTESSTGSRRPALQKDLSSSTESGSKKSSTGKEGAMHVLPSMETANATWVEDRIEVVGPKPAESGVGTREPYLTL